ncbi:hypothetical protein N9Y75_02425, partial [Candidatus Poseidoniales archaeon]|nr:hypothetical protein [Candidatus Poseidoniales archaeon]
MSDKMASNNFPPNIFAKLASILLVMLFLTQANFILVTNNTQNDTRILAEQNTIKLSTESSAWLGQNQSVPHLGLAGVEIVAYHPLSDEVLLHGNSSYSIGHSTSTETIDGTTLFPSQDYMNGQYRSLEYCVISGKSSSNQGFTKVLSSSATDVKCEVIESFDFGIRIIGTIACDSNPCPGSNNAFNLSWNGTVDFSRSCTGCFFILDLDWNGSFARVNTISVNGVSSSTNCQMPSIVDATVSPNNSTFLLTRHSKNGYTTSSNYPCNWSPTGSTPSWSAASHSHILWMHNSSGVGNWWVKTGYNADDVYVGISNRFAKLVPSEYTDSVYVVGESGVGSTNADCGKSPITTSCHFHYHSSNGYLVTNHPFNANLGNGLPYISHFSSSGSHLDSEILDIDDNGQYYREEYSGIEELRHVSNNLAFISLSYTQDNRQNTDNAQFVGQNLTAGQDNGFFIDLNSSSITINQTSNLSSSIVLQQLSGSKVIGHSTTSNLIQYFENESVAWSTPSVFGTPTSVSYRHSNHSLVANSFIELTQSTQTYGNLTLNIGTPGYYHLRVWYSPDYDGDNLANEIDPDSDNDEILDIYDNCLTGILFTSNLIVDGDQDGCRDSDEDLDDDGDGKNDTTDQCATGTMYWTRNSTTDYDDDGCNDASEDFNDDNDNFQDFEDMCPRLIG